METNTPEKLLNALEIEEANIESFQTPLNLSRTDIADCQQDRANLQVSLNNVGLVEADKKNVTKVKNDIYEGDSKEDISPYPAFELTALPFPTAKGGALARYQNRRGRARLASGYTLAIGQAMGYESEPAARVSDEQLSAALEWKDLGGYRYEVEFSKQGKSAMLVQERPKGTEKWAKEHTALQSPKTIAADAPAQEGATVQIEIRCRLLDGDEPVGQWSPIYPVTLNA